MCTEASAGRAGQPGCEKKRRHFSEMRESAAEATTTHAPQLRLLEDIPLDEPVGRQPLQPANQQPPKRHVCETQGRVKLPFLRQAERTPSEGSWARGSGDEDHSKCVMRHARLTQSVSGCRGRDEREGKHVCFAEPGCLTI